MEVLVEVALLAELGSSRTRTSGWGPRMRELAMAWEVGGGLGRVADSCARRPPSNLWTGLQHFEVFCLLEEAEEAACLVVDPVVPSWDEH